MTQVLSSLAFCDFCTPSMHDLKKKLTYKTKLFKFQCETKEGVYLTHFMFHLFVCIK